MSNPKTRWILADGPFPKISVSEPRWKDEIRLDEMLLELDGQSQFSETELTGVYKAHNGNRIAIDSRVCASKFFK